MRKVLVFALPVLALAACDPAVPNSAAGVGFGDYQSYLRNREAELQGRPAPTAAPTSAAAPVATSSTLPPAAAGVYGANGYGATQVTSAAGQARPSADTQLATAAASAPQGTIGAEALAALQATAPGGSTTTAAPFNTADAGEKIGAPLDAVSSTGRATPAPITEATTRGSAGPNLAAYALAATNTPGQSVYERGGFKMVSEKKVCAKYISPDLAQTAFLEKGGPVRDPGNLDPDGDGFACGWDPRPFQAARK